MKTLSHLLVVALLCSLTPHASAAGKPQIVVVFDIQDRSGRFPAEALSELTEYFATQIAQGSAYRVVPRTQLKQRLKAQKTTSYKRCYDEKCQIEVGRELSAQKLISTRIIRVGTKCAVTSTLFDLRTSTSERAASQKAVCDQDSLVAALELVATQLKGSGAAVATPRPPRATPPSPGITPAPPRPQPRAGGITPAPRPRPQPAYKPRPAPRYQPRPAPRRRPAVTQRALNRSGLYFSVIAGISLPDDSELDTGYTLGGQVGWEFRLGSRAAVAAGLHVSYHSWEGTNYDFTGSLIDIAPAARFSVYLNKLILAVNVHVGYGEMEIVLPDGSSGAADGTTIAGGVEALWAASSLMGMGIGLEYLSAQPSDWDESFDVMSLYLAWRLKF